MSDRASHPFSSRRLGGGLLAVLALTAGARAEEKNRPEPPKAASALVRMEDWRAAATTPLTAEEIDRLIARELQAAKVPTSPRTTDEQFLRRVTLDVTGRLPTARQVAEFVADADPAKRARVIDRLLDSDDYARHWARYWRSVISAKVTANVFGQRLARPFETWMTGQLKENKSWAEVARAMLTAEGEVLFDDDGSKGYAYFLAARMGADAVVEQAAETSRVFLGIQIQCAQCHNHPSDVWKQQQFHEFAAYFGRLAPRLKREEQRFVGVTLGAGFRDYQMPDKDNPRRGIAVYPKFLNGNSPGRFLGDLDRRKALVKEITDKNNPWFAAAYVNRVWGALMGQSFYQPVDDLGPEKEATFGPVLTRLAGGFRGGDYDMKELFRVVLNTETYQRQIRLGDSPSAHLRFAAVYPTRLPGDVLWNALNAAVGPFGGGGFGGPRPGGGGGRPGLFGGLEGLFRQEFSFDPSLRPEDVEGSVPQALMLMNNPQIQQRIDARGDTPLARILKDNAKDEDALEQVYLRTLSRKPTEREREKSLNYVKKVGNRAEAFEDILWALINSTEFRTRR